MNLPTQNQPSTLANVQSISLPTGILTIQVNEAHVPLEDLVRIAARQNRKRGFLFASTVLGKHIPAQPKAIRKIHNRLATLLPDLQGPVLFIGMAETAIALGHGVFDQFLAETGRRDAVYLHTTRYRVDKPTFLEFKEEHSHAAQHYLYLPTDSAARNVLLSARTVVIIDDEASTGKTFHNLLEELKLVLPSIEQAVTVVITDWRGVRSGRSNADSMAVPTFPVAVLHGEYTFAPADDLISVQTPPSVGNDLPKDAYLRGNFGRFGLLAKEPLKLDRESWRQLGLQIRARSKTGERNRVLVLGTGEFAYPPFLMAEYLERMGIDVWYQSTTRSPLMQCMAIEERFVFKDNYADDIMNYLYNARRQDYELIIIGHETPRDSVDELCELLNARTMAF